MKLKDLVGVVTGPIYLHFNTDKDDTERTWGGPDYNDLKTIKNLYMLNGDVIFMKSEEFTGNGHFLYIELYIDWEMDLSIFKEEKETEISN